MYNEIGEKLKELLKIEREPVAIKWSVKTPKNIPKVATNAPTKELSFIISAPKYVAIVNIGPLTV